MFVQVIQGHVSDAAAVKAQLDRWVAELAPSASGWLGSTAGVTDDGHLVALARFESADAAQRNSDRPEQSAWWEETAKLFAAPVGKTVADYAMQVMGGAGYCREYPVERLWRDAKLVEIGGGTLEAHQKNLAKDLAALYGVA